MRFDTENSINVIFPTKAHFLSKRSDPNQTKPNRIAYVGKYLVIRCCCCCCNELFLLSVYRTESVGDSERISLHDSSRNYSASKRWFVYLLLTMVMVTFRFFTIQFTWCNFAVATTNFHTEPISIDYLLSYLHTLLRNSDLCAYFILFYVLNYPNSTSAQNKMWRHMKHTSIDVIFKSI